MNRIEQRVKRLEEEAPRGPCNHPLGIMINPTEEKVGKREKKLADCHNCRRHGSGLGPDLMIIRLRAFTSSEPGGR